LSSSRHGRVPVRASLDREGEEVHRGGGGPGPPHHVQAGCGTSVHGCRGEGHAVGAWDGQGAGGRAAAEQSVEGKDGGGMGLTRSMWGSETGHWSTNASPPTTPRTCYVCMDLEFCFFSECDNVGAGCPLGACTTHGSVVVTSTLSLFWLSIPSGFLVVFEKPNRSSFTITFTCTCLRWRSALPWRLHSQGRLQRC
jgi:hypothetical protein